MARRGVKKFTTWEYTDGKIKLQVPVSSVDATKSSYRSHDEEKVYFSVQMVEPEIDERDTDINRLRETVFEKIKEQLKIEWKSMLVVEVEAGRYRLFDKKRRPDTPNTESRGKGSLRLRWQRVQITTVNGQKMQRSFNNYHEPFDKKEPSREFWNSACNGWPEVGEKAKPRYGGNDDPQISAMIPDTPENRVALEAIADQIEKLYDGLKRLMNSKQIEQTLARVATNGLLALQSPQTEATDE